MQKVLNVNPALRVPLPSPRLETRPPSHGQVYRFAASDDGTSCDVRVHDVLVDALLKQRPPRAPP